MLRYLISLIRVVTVRIILMGHNAPIGQFLPYSSEPCPSYIAVTMEPDCDTAAIADEGSW